MTGRGGRFPFPPTGDQPCHATHTGSAPHQVLATHDGDNSLLGGSNKGARARIAIDQPPRGECSRQPGQVQSARGNRRRSISPYKTASFKNELGPHKTAPCSKILSPRVFIRRFGSCLRLLRGTVRHWGIRGRNLRTAKGVGVTGAVRETRGGSVFSGAGRSSVGRHRCCRSLRRHRLKYRAPQIRVALKKWMGGLLLGRRRVALRGRWSARFERISRRSRGMVRPMG